MYSRDQHGDHSIYARLSQIDVWDLGLWSGRFMEQTDAWTCLHWPLINGLVSFLGHSNKELVPLHFQKMFSTAIIRSTSALSL